LTSIGTGGKHAYVWDTSSGRLLHRVLLHGGAHCVGLAASGDGKYLALFGAADEAVLVDRATGEQLHRWVPATKDSALAELAFAADGVSLLTLALDGTVTRYSVPHGRLFGRYRSVANQFPCGALSPDGRWLVAREINTAKAPKDGDVYQVLDAGTAQPVANLPGGSANCGRFTWSLDGRFVGCVKNRKTVLVWDAMRGKELIGVDEPVEVKLLAIAADAGAVAWMRNGSDPALVVWDVRDGKIRWSWPVPSADAAVAFSRHGKVLAIATDEGVIHMLDATTGRLQPASEHPGHFGQPTAFFPDGRSVLVSCDEEWLRSDVATGKTVARFGTGRNWQLSPDGRHVASFHAKENTLRLFTTASGQLQWQMPLVPGTVLFSPDGRQVVVLTSSGECHFDVASGQKVALPLAAVHARGDILGLSNDFRWRVLASADSSELVVVNVQTGAVRQRWTSPDLQKQWSTVLVSPGGDRLVARSQSAWQLLDSARGAKLKRWEHDTPGAFTDDGKHLLLRRGPTTTLLWDVQRNQQALHFFDAPVTAAASDGRVLAVSDGSSIELWDIPLGQRIRTLAGGPVAVDHLTFSPDGRTLAATGGGSVLFWDTTNLAREPGRLPRLDLALADLERLWTELSGSDAEPASRAFWKLAAAGDKTLGWLRPRLQPVPDPGRQTLTRLVADLESNSYATRAKATRQLETLESARDLLLETLPRNLTLEMRKRVEHVLSKLDALLDSPALRLQLRGVDLLEQLGTAESQAFLEELAAGAAQAQVTCAAGRALSRLKSR
jgi:WD40 repeat protein